MHERRQGRHTAPPSNMHHYCLFNLFLLFLFLHCIRPPVCVSTGVSLFSSEVFRQLWLSVCITEVVTLTSCLIPGPLSLIDGQSKHRGLGRLSACDRMQAFMCGALNKYARLTFRALLNASLLEFNCIVKLYCMSI